MSEHVPNNSSGQEPSESLQRIQTTFHLAATWESLRDAPLADFESCDTTPITTIRLQALPPSKDTN